MSVKRHNLSLTFVDVKLVALMIYFQEIDVLMSELSSLKNVSQVYEGSPSTVLFTKDATSMKSQLKKEKSSLVKKSPNSASLAF